VNNEQINYIFLTRYCKSEGILNGYLTYRYQPSTNKQIEISVQESHYVVRLTRNLGNGIYEYLGNRLAINKEEYLSRRIHEIVTLSN
jgi:hypothetical protein